MKLKKKAGRQRKKKRNEMKRDETETNNVNVQGNKNINENENKKTKITVNDTRTHSCNISNEITMQTDQTHFSKERVGKRGRRERVAASQSFIEPSGNQANIFDNTL